MHSAVFNFISIFTECSSQLSKLFHNIWFRKQFGRVRSELATICMAASEAVSSILLWGWGDLPGLPTPPSPRSESANHLHLRWSPGVPCFSGPQIQATVGNLYYLSSLAANSKQSRGQSTIIKE